jgi:hypothetical protein
VHEFDGGDCAQRNNILKHNILNEDGVTQGGWLIEKPLVIGDNSCHPAPRSS